MLFGDGAAAACISTERDAKMGKDQSLDRMICPAGGANVVDAISYATASTSERFASRADCFLARARSCNVRCLTLSSKSTRTSGRTGPSQTQIELSVAGLLFDDAGHRMVPTHATNNGVRYRYYISRPHLYWAVEDGNGWVGPRLHCRHRRYHRQVNCGSSEPSE